MTKIKLVYFNSRGRAEIARLILAQAGVDYEDVRIEREAWPELKPTTPTGQVPVLEYGGETIGQSMAIARFLAREHGLAGKDSWETARVDMVVDCINDLRDKFRPAMMEADAGKKAEMMSKFKTDALESFMKNMEAILVKNGGKHFVGNKLTWADIYMANMMETYAALSDSCFKETAPPNLAKLVEDTLALPNIKKWIETRPKTER